MVINLKRVYGFDNKSCCVDILTSSKRERLKKYGDFLPTLIYSTKPLWLSFFCGSKKWEILKNVLKSQSVSHPELGIYHTSVVWITSIIHSLKCAFPSFLKLKSFSLSLTEKSYFCVPQNKNSLRNWFIKNTVQYMPEYIANSSILKNTAVILAQVPIISLK